MVATIGSLSGRPWGSRPWRNQPNSRWLARQSQRIAGVMPRIIGGMGDPRQQNTKLPLEGTDAPIVATTDRTDDEESSDIVAPRAAISTRNKAIVNRAQTAPRGWIAPATVPSVTQTRNRPPSQRRLPIAPSILPTTISQAPRGVATRL